MSKRFRYRLAGSDVATFELDACEMPEEKSGWAVADRQASTMSARPGSGPGRQVTFRPCPN